ncbi:MAG: gliding motility-associated C-terminal domain-containing protein [Chitinophagaceae bacterium]|nr:gliding motility-associated C-terminal domain-containing protein [Chitinophagaceae bacterium]
MRRCLILTVLLIVAQLNGLFAQTTFVAPDTVCIRQPITMYPTDTTDGSYYWSFCSGYMMDRPVGKLLGSTFGIVDASDIEIGKDNSGNYYGFVINRAIPEFVRLDFGNSLSNIPTHTSLGNLGGTISLDANGLFLMKVGNNHVMFVVGGSTIANSSISRLDFGTSLGSKPNCVNMGNLGGLLNGPRGFFAAKEGPYWFGFVANALDGKLIRFDFGTNISNTPNPIDVGNPSGAFGDPSDMAAIRDNIGDWHIFVTNFAANNIVHVGFGSSLASIPAASILPTNLANLFNPSSIILAKECGVDYAFVTNATSNNFVRLAFSDLPTLTFQEQNYTFMTGLKSSLGLSHFIREKDNIYAFSVNGDGSLGSINFANCNSSISTLRNSAEKFPPAFSYHQPGRYSVFLSKNEGTPEMSMECHVITALPIPAITIVDDTLVCQGDTATLFGIAFGTDTLRWMPNYNITQIETLSDGFFTKVAPDYSRPYHFIAIYPNGCIVDSPIVVTVNKVNADAGIDRVIGDGARTVVGGPMTSEGSNFRYEWTPTNFLDNPLAPNPTSNPLYDIAYSLKVTNTFGCVSTDTVVIKVSCEDVNLPNAFTPEDHSTNNDYFGLKNKNIVQLNYFRIFDRWGKEVFSTTDISEQWNGQFEGVDCPYGVYVWTVNGFCSSGKPVAKSGNVTLLR